MYTCSALTGWCAHGLATSSMLRPFAWILAKFCSPRANTSFLPLSHEYCQQAQAARPVRRRRPFRGVWALADGPQLIVEPGGRPCVELKTVPIASRRSRGQEPLSQRRSV